MDDKGNALELRDVTKRYGDFSAVDGLSLVVPKGCIYGFLGPNGAGKTTTLRMLGGVLPPTAGDIWIDGISLSKDPVEARRRMSFIPDRPYLYDKLTAREFLLFLADIYGMSRAGLLDRVDARLAEQHLLEQADALIESFSHGMKQQIGRAHV